MPRNFGQALREIYYGGRNPVSPILEWILGNQQPPHVEPQRPQSIYDIVGAIYARAENEGVVGGRYDATLEDVFYNTLVALDEYCDGDERDTALIVYDLANYSLKNAPNCFTNLRQFSDYWCRMIQETSSFNLSQKKQIMETDLNEMISRIMQ